MKSQMIHLFFWPHLKRVEVPRAGFELMLQLQPAPQLRQCQILTHCATGNFQFTFCLFVCLFGFLGPYPWNMEVPRLGVKSKLQLLAYTTAKAMPDPSHICDLHCSMKQCQILNPLNAARDWTFNPHRHYIRFLTHWATRRTPFKDFNQRNGNGLDQSLITVHEVRKFLRRTRGKYFRICGS